MNGKARGSGYFRLPDLFIIMVFLSIAAFSVDMFRRDLLQTFSLRNVEPAGIVIIKKNTVQRRISGRVLWDRLARESPVYIGDLIRVAEISAATLHIDDNNIDLDENTLIRITRAADGESLQIVLTEGALSLATGTEDKNVGIDLNVIQVLAGPETVVSAEASKNGDVSVLVHKGNIQIIEANGTVREVPSGTMIAMDAGGTELKTTTAVVTQPVPNTRYVKTTKDPLPINFFWNTINLAPNEKLRMEIASDRNFTRIYNVIENLTSQTQVRFDPGLWYWRLLFNNTVLTMGRLTIADGSGPTLQSPAFNSLFRSRDEPQAINFQWEEVPEAVSYIVEVSNTADFSNPQIRRQTSVTSMTDSTLGEGTWFWRVMPVFPSVFSGSAAFSTPSFFRIGPISAVPAETAGAGETSVTAETSAAAEAVSLSQWLALYAPFEKLPSDLPPEIIPLQFINPPEPPPEPPPEINPPQPAKPPEPPPPQIKLSSPAQGARINGLTALRQQTVFRWDTDAKPVKSRFVLSKNSNPLRGRPAREITNPNRVIRIDRITEGTWYWTVELQTSSGLIASAPPRRFQVQPIPLLPSPRNLQPVTGTSFGLQDFRSQRTIVFDWSEVRGANAYIFTLYQQVSTKRRQIVRETINSGTGYTLTDLRLLDKGAFVWQVEAVNIGRANTIEQRGAAGESTFIIDFPSSAPLQMEDTGIMYGNE